MGYNLIEVSNRELPVRSSVRLGDFAKIPFRTGHYAVENTGSTASFQESGITSNEDGTDTGFNISVPNGLNNGVRIRVPFYGRAFGIRWRRDSNACDFSVAIDGVSYGSFTGKHNYLINDSASLTDGESLVLVTDDLAEGTHYAEIVVVSGASTNAILFYGLLLEKRVGYSEKPRAKTIVSTTAVTTSAVAIPKGSSPNIVRTVEKIIYTNTTASAISVTVINNGSVMWQKSVPANDSIELILGTTLLSWHTHQASATGVNATVIGGY
jgi:hypothetical protein